MGKRIVSFTWFLLVMTAASVLAQGHTDPFIVAVDTSDAGWEQVCYNSRDDEYLAVWEDYRNGPADIYGQFLNGDGTLKGENFPICRAEGHQFWPHLDYDLWNQRYLVVFEDWRDPKNGDIRGIFVNRDGTFFNGTTATEDHTFLICSNPAGIYTCSVAFNHELSVYLVAWGDFRNDPNHTSFIGADVYGQLISSSGQLLPPPAPADPAANFIIAANPGYEESVADVTYHYRTNEFLVSYGTSMGIVMVQRVKHTGELITPDGDTLPAGVGFGAPLPVSDVFSNDADGLQAKVQGNTEQFNSIDDFWECLVTWKGIHIPDRMDNDVWGQRIGFFKKGEKLLARCVNLKGDSSAALSNFPISLQNDWVGVPELAYGWQDNEFLVGWGDPRTFGGSYQDLYCQRLAVDRKTHSMAFLDDDRINTVTAEQNIPLLVSAKKYEGSIMGIAHGARRNEFCMAYSFYDPGLGRKADIMGLMVKGTRPTTATASRSAVPVEFNLSSNYPNPFNQSTSIDFVIPAAGRVTVWIQGVTGRRVRTLMLGQRPAGSCRIIWDGRDESGIDAPTGVYYCRVCIGDQARVVKMALVR